MCIDSISQEDYGFNKIYFLFVIFSSAKHICFHMVSEPSMTSSSTLIPIKSINNSNQLNQVSQILFTFALTVELDRSNFLLWHKQVSTSISGNRLAGFISEAQTILNQ